jgi:hypothetical protein
MTGGVNLGPWNVGLRQSCHPNGDTWLIGGPPDCGSDRRERTSCDSWGRHALRRDEGAHYTLSKLVSTLRGVFPASPSQRTLPQNLIAAGSSDGQVDVRSMFRRLAAASRELPEV